MAGRHHFDSVPQSDGRTELCALRSLVSGRATTNDSLLYCVSACPSKFIHVQVAGFNGCYSFGSPNTSWHVAAESCKSLHSNSHLVVIDNAAEQNAIVYWWHTHPGKQVDDHDSSVI